MEQNEVSGMKQLSWEEYYDNFYEWSPSIQRNYTYRLTGYGPAEEVWEVAQELDFYDTTFAVKFLKKAFDAGVRFTPEQVLEMALTVDQPFLNKLAEQADGTFSEEQLEEIDLLIDDVSFQKISHGVKSDAWGDGSAARQDQHCLPQKKKKVDLISALAALAAGAALADREKEKYNARCNGDCANCPPHYGYRYGRWYYGKGHQYGCEFGGNKGDGSLE